MATRYCIGCGAPLQPGAQFCASCGRAVDATPASAPLPTAPAPASPSGYGSGGSDFGASSAPPPRPRASRRLKIVVVLVVVVLIIASIGILYAISQPSPNVAVSGINFYAPDNVCDLNTDPIGYYGFNATPGSSQTYIFEISNNNTTACTIHSVVTNTSGFSLSGVTVPLTIGAMGNGNLTATINMPSSRFSGLLNFVLS